MTSHKASHRFIRVVKATKLIIDETEMEMKPFVVFHRFSPF